MRDWCRSHPRVDLAAQAALPFEPAPKPKPAELEAAFAAWLDSPDGQAVLLEVVRRALRLRERGVVRFGIKALWEAMRYDRALELGPDADGFRLNNNYASRLARLAMKAQPELEGFFETRELRR